MPKLPKIVFMRHPRLEDEPRFFVLRERGESWNENATTVRLGGDWVVILEQRPTRADILGGIGCQGRFPDIR